MHAGIEQEGETPQASTEDMFAFKAHALLANGMGGHDWAGLGVVCAWLGITDIDGLLQRLLIIKTHNPQGTD